MHVMREGTQERSPMGSGGSTSPAPSRFTGPVFIVGMHRSGTKLLRDLLRGHPRIRIPPAGTQFLPRWLAEWERFGDLSDPACFSAFYRWNRRAPYFLYLSRHPEGTIREDVWYASCRTFEPEDVFEALIRHDVGAPSDSDLVWGDRSPDYINHIDLLAELFPRARFIHIVRDARDRCLSIKRRNAATTVRAAQRWADGVTKARHDGQRVADRYIDVRYEDLLADPELELRRCCDFLGLEFDPSMLTLKYSTEHTGDAKGAREVVAANTRKYLRAMDSRTIHRIEKIAGAALREFGYEVEYSGPVRRVPRPLMSCYRLLDGLNYVRVQARRLGLVRNAQFQLGRLTRN
jgi:hypothetical protein